jgi:type II secretory pathway pseudopilin PulG
VTPLRHTCGERGETSLVGLLVAMIIFAVILGATLTLFGSAQTTSRVAGERTEAADRARDATDRIAKALRNLASPSIDQPLAIDSAGPYDLVFKTVEPSRPATSSLNLTATKRVRYCLRTTDPTRAQLIEQTQTWTTASPPAAPATVACGVRTGWTRTEVIADRITNVIGGGNRPVFTYNSATTAAISMVHTELFVDPDPTSSAKETTLSSGVFLRNQNRRPTARFTVTPSATGLVLNGSASVDPEGETLQYYWTVNGVAVGNTDGSNITFTYPITAPVADRIIQLRVVDPAGLDDTSATQTVRA